MIVYVNGKQEGITYNKRIGAYAIIQGEEGKIAIATDGEFFLIGGGIEKGETPIQALKREVLEETGYTIKEVRYLTQTAEYAYVEERGGYTELGAIVYIAKFDKKTAKPIEEDHKVIWGLPEELTPKIKFELQRYAVREYQKLV